ncbi:iron hydrogenase small subunit [Vallitalea pronyensis]|uniref:Iron hydrogenase small subunit n=1 Tax=Vallitalea pronyensis TaxID=1348613 RepID=A0A8J8MJK0_9FIRM|nr:NADH-dependent [FeFe] hydrogenase, group A6 [Vallitalea pronyensis]QUI22835.1 iron hydrogenase small subunit [Vallitalea pronyensis]
MVKITINNKQLEVPSDVTILQAAKMHGILIPNFCFLEGVHKNGSCRICSVEVEGAKSLQAACMTNVTDGMVVHTNTKKVRQARKIIYELMLSNHPKDCLSCDRNRHCEFQELGEVIGVSENPYEGDMSIQYVDDNNPSIVRDLSKCVLCRRCVTMCNEVQGVGILNNQNRGFDTFVGPSEGFDLDGINCSYCGQCTTVCPVDALSERDSINDVWRMLHEEGKRVIVQTAPAVRAALGEEFGYAPGTLVTGKMAAALRELGFHDIFDTNFAADLTIIEEGNEFLQRLTKAVQHEEVSLPMITSCSPGWIKYIENRFPEQLDHLSSCKSPHMMLGALAKSFYAEKIGVDPKDIYVVSIMPCTAKKYEITRPEMKDDVDAVLTTRELGKMIKEAGIDFRNLEDGEFDKPFGISTGAADIFGTTGGVMEAAIRTVFEIITGTELPFENLHVKPIMGLSSIKEGELFIEKATDDYKAFEGQTVKVAVASGLTSARLLLQQIEDGVSPYHFIEIMACPGGCISGGGQPRPTNAEIREKRMEAIYREDEGKELRKSHDNPAILKLYEDFLGEPLGHKSHELLHTHYVKRGVYNELT